MNKPTQGQKTEVKMEIRVQSIKFNADQKLLDFIDKKFSRIEKFYDAVTGVDVALSLLPDHENKNVKVQVAIPGNTIVVEKNAKTFEDAVVDCADILKEKLVKEKEKRAE
jgi:ribosomal subunit interface protein